MKGLLLGTDYIIDKNTGDVKVLEVNTNARAISKGDFLSNYDFTELFNFISSSNFTSVDVIHQSFNWDVASQIETFCSGSGITFTRHLTNHNSITVPYIEDADDKFILRMSYDTTAIIDEDYAKDKFKLARAIQGTANAPKTYIKSTDVNVDELASLPDFNYSGSSPNFIVKKRIPQYDKGEYPKCFKFENKTQLNNFTSSLGSDELLQEFIDCTNSDDNRRLIHRSIDIVYGSDLTPIPLGAYKVTHIVEEDIWENTYSSGSWGDLALKDRAKYVTYYNSDSLTSRSYIYDQNQKVLMGDGSFSTFASCSADDIVKALDLPGLDLDEQTYDITEWTGSYTETVTSASLVNTVVVTKHSSNATNEYFNHITLNDGNTFDDISSTTLLIKSGSEVKFKPIGQAEIGDEIVMYNVSSSNVEVKTITNINTIWKEDTVLGSMDVEPYDLFLPFVHNDYTIIQHNPCVQPQCGYNSCAPFGQFQGNRSCNTCYSTQCIK